MYKKILGIETSCDETAVAIVENGRHVVESLISSQVDIHREYGGVIPEIAAREHVVTINVLLDEIFMKTNLTIKDIDAIAVTAGPGLVGALIVGFNAAKSIAFACQKPFIPINHLYAHVCANYIDTDLEPPFISLLVSGGHTQIILVENYKKYKILGKTLDDAAGEVYDKVARLLGIPYPGGPLLDKLAHKGDKAKYNLPTAKVKGYDFSFSGLKTAVLYLLKEIKQNYLQEDLAASFQEVVTETLYHRTLLAAKDLGLHTIVLAGGVAANSALRQKFIDTKDFQIYLPPLKYCTDNAAMVASAAYFMNTPSDLSCEVFTKADLLIQ